MDLTVTSFFEFLEGLNNWMVSGNSLENRIKKLMSETKIEILEINQEPNSSLSSSDRIRLFRGTSLPYFDLVDIRQKATFCKHPTAAYFLTIVEKWNQKAQDVDRVPTNTRTEQQLIDFIHSSLKKVCLMTGSQIDTQLRMLYNWYTTQSKSNPATLQPSMPQKTLQNELYNVTKTFRTDPNMLLKQYLRPRFLLSSIDKENVMQTENQSELMRTKLNLSEKKILEKDKIQEKPAVTMNNFLTELNTREPSRKIQLNKQSSKCLLFRRQTVIRNDELRKTIEKKDIDAHEWKFRMNKGRLVAQNVKNYLSENQYRATKSSSSNRHHNLKDEIFEEMKKNRIKSSFGKRLTITRNTEAEVNPALVEINNIGLLPNPFEIKLKKKKKGKK